MQGSGPFAKETERAEGVSHPQKRNLPSKEQKEIEDPE